MHRLTHVCFPCMKSRRAGLGTGPVCPKCNKPMIRLHYRVRIPKQKPRLWKEFFKWLTDNYPYYRKWRAADGSYKEVEPDERSY